jgi:hypothetical protein
MLDITTQIRRYSRREKKKRKEEKKKENRVVEKRTRGKEG